MFETGTILDNKYQIQAHLGTGGMGEVYRVLDPGARSGLRAQNFE